MATPLSYADDFLDYFSGTENGFISFFKDNGVGGRLSFYTTGVILVETDFWKLSEEFLKFLMGNINVGVQVFFKHTTLFRDTVEKNENRGTFPAVGSLKNIEEVLKLINLNSLNFIMED